MFSLFDVVELKEDIPDEGLYAGMVGAVIEVYCEPTEGYEVEFCDEQGRTITQLALPPEKLKLSV
ncbi:DUF4926 domain-containing protein [Achromobacter denitrificans]|uniref:DUF4926 domain-containing protein n=1 Tax=Achromobacter denitrificans TaxID=32002 RepID=UPI0014679AE7|nr:DUF4926 domain-containing protein [Achromobacter denitrificans]MDF3848000.1 DUF4926 domain-containing protein [Achromobacter denitrificans]CAB3916803.1 hypothetical protein LMG1860_06162 [Achromobacter denitrificans]